MNLKFDLFSDAKWARENGFSVLGEISKLLEGKEHQGRNALVRILEQRENFSEYEEIIDDLIQKAGLYPYLIDQSGLGSADLLNYEYHSVDGMEDIFLHSAQARVYRALMDGVNVILSAPTSFGKSLLIDAVIASGRFKSIVVIVPTIALIDETRRRLSQRFGGSFKIITHGTQAQTGSDIFILTQERFIEYQRSLKPDFFVLDEFYKLSPNRGDERTFTLNQAFYELFKSGSQFFLIGPNVQDIKVDERDLNFRFFRFDFSTVATEVRYSSEGTQEENAVRICREVTDPTIIFCKSAASAYKLADVLIKSEISRPTDGSTAFSEWLNQNYHEGWELSKLLSNGMAVHHGSLPRSVAYHILRKFNDGDIPFLFCTSTIIEGVNTSAKNIIIYDNKIATSKFDQFTFNNIKGRAGRMFKHFIGYVYVLHPAPDPELPVVDIPSITQPQDSPQSLLIHLDQGDLTDHSKEQLRYLHAQDYIPMDILKQNSGMAPDKQVALAKEITDNLSKYAKLLTWRGFPSKDHLPEACRLIFDFLMDSKGKDGVFSAKQMNFLISRFAKTRSIPDLINEEIANPNSASVSEAVENTLRFLRQWCEFHFPRYLGALDRIQRVVFEKNNISPGDYSPFIFSVKHLFMHPAVTVLEEYGLPYNITQKIIKRYSLGEDVDEFLEQIRAVNVSELNLSNFEEEMLRDVLKNIY